MNIKYPNNVILAVSIVSVLLGGTILLSGYAISKPADTAAPAKQGCCPAMIQTVACPQMAAMQAETKECDKTPCTEVCPKPCCAGENADGDCDNPCPVPCPKPCCAEEAPKSCCGLDQAEGSCPMESAAQ